MATGKAKSDPCRDLRGALAPAQEKHHAALTTKDGARAVMRALDAYQGSFVVCAAVRFTALTFVGRSNYVLLHGMRSIGKRGCG